MRTLRAAIYRRKSSDDHKDAYDDDRADVSDSVAAQAEECRNIIMEQGWKLVKNGGVDY